MVSWDDLPSSSEDDSVTSKEVPSCNYVEWVDPEWPDAMKMGLARIWGMYEEETKQNLRQNVLNVEENLKIMEEKKKMEKELSNFKLDFAAMAAEKEQAISQLGSTQVDMANLKEELAKRKMNDKTVTSIHQVFRAKAEKRETKSCRRGTKSLERGIN
ncbi:hypothetical protein VPH35_116643 [Triticum aestivum]